MTLWVISICHWKPHETLFQTGQINTCTPLLIKLNSVVGNIEYCGSFGERKILVTGQATTSISCGYQITNYGEKIQFSFIVKELSISVYLLTPPCLLTITSFGAGMRHT